jgi:hypothetical protein
MEITWMERNWNNAIDLGNCGISVGMAVRHQEIEVREPAKAPERSIRSYIQYVKKGISKFPTPVPLSGLPLHPSISQAAPQLHD